MEKRFLPFFATLEQETGLVPVQHAVPPDTPHRTKNQNLAPPLTLVIPGLVHTAPPVARESLQSSEGCC